MNLADVKALAAALAPAIADAVKAATSPLLARIAELEVRPQARELSDEDLDLRIAHAVRAAFEAAPKPRDGRDVDPEDVARQVKAEVAQAVADLPAPRDGKDADPDLVKRLVFEEVAAQLAELPPVEPKAVDMDAVAELIAAEVAKLPPPEPGKSVDPAEVLEMVAQAVAAQPPVESRAVDMDAVAELIAAEVAKLPPAEPGKSVDPAAVAELVEASVAKAVAALPEPKDGVGLADALIDRNGDLALTLTDGSMRRLGCVVGRDVDMGVVRSTIVDEVAKIPRPRDGVDGFSLDAFGAEMKDDGRTLLLKFEAGERVQTYTFDLPVMLYRGVFREREEGYVRGDCVTWAGSLWHCNEPTSEKPDSGKAWTLAVKKGAPGKDARGGA